ncbi:MAG: hypothetical protein AB1333_03370 [Patescibacteria group bacterium]
MEKNDKFREIRRELHSTVERIIDLLMGKLVPYKSRTCCGKPVVFHYPETRYECGRCGSIFTLVVEVKKQKPH